MGLSVPLVVLGSPYRSLLRPLLEYIEVRGDDQMGTIVLPEFLSRRWWQHVLHNQNALLVKGALLLRESTVVADVPYLLKRCGGGYRRIDPGGAMYEGEPMPDLGAPAEGAGVVGDAVGTNGAGAENTRLPVASGAPSSSAASSVGRGRW